MERIEKFTNKVIENLKLRQKELRDTSFEIQKIFSDILANERVIVTCRLKSENSLKEKIVRKSLHERFNSEKELIDKLDDIIGIRIVCLLHDDEKLIFDNLKSNFTENEKYYIKEIGKSQIKLEKITLPAVQKNNHSIYKVSGSYINIEKKEYKFELQIKSSVHMLWGEIEHMLFYKNYEYHIGKNFYTVIMDSIYNSLLEIDKQLSEIKNEMQNNKNSFQEIKRILARFLYTKLQNEIQKIFDFEIDLIDYYDSIIEIKLREFEINSLEDFNINFSKIMLYINNIKSELLIEFIKKDKFENLKLDLENQDLKNKIKIAIKEKNKEIYFRIFSFLFSQDKNDEDKNENILEEITDFYFLYTIENRNISWPFKNSSYVIEIMDNHLDFIACIDTEGIDDIEKENLSTIITDLLILKTNIDNKLLVSKELLKKILENIKKIDNDIFTDEFENEFSIIVNKFEFKKDISKKLKKLLSMAILSDNEEVNFYNE